MALGTSKILPIRDFGRLMAIGMALGFCVVFLFIPAAMRKLRALNFERNADEDDGVRPARGLVRIFQGIALARPALVIVLRIMVLVVSGLGARKISADAKFTSYFWPESEVYRGLEFTNGLKAMLISDPTTDKSSAALDVQIGKGLSSLLSCQVVMYFHVNILSSHICGKKLGKYM